MGTKTIARSVLRRFLSNGKVLGEEEKAAENIYIKKIEQEKLAKLAYKDPKTEQQESTGSIGSSSFSSGKTGKVRTGKSPSYTVMAGTVAVFGTLGWYLNWNEKKIEKRS